MALNLSQMAADLAHIEADIPQSVTIGGVAYACVTGGPQDGKELEMEGFGGTASFQLVVRCALFTGNAVRPEVDALVTHDGRQYRVASIDADASGVSYILNLTEQHR
jgi:hypothetical protein